MLQRHSADGAIQLVDVGPARTGRLLVGLLAFFGLPALAGCDSGIDTGPSVPIPVVQSLLVAGDSIQIAWVEWRVPAESAFTTDVRPVDTGLVQLSLVLPGGISVPFAPAAGIPGRFDAAATVNPGTSYGLQGTVAGLTVSGSTAVPQLLDVRAPAQDTIRFPSGACFGLCPLPYELVAPGATGYLFVQTRQQPGGGSVTLQIDASADSAGILYVFQSRSGPDTATLALYAVEPHAAAFILRSTPKSSLTGIFGLFGAATRATRRIIWE